MPPRTNTDRVPGAGRPSRGRGGRVGGLACGPRPTGRGKGSTPRRAGRGLYRTLSYPQFSPPTDHVSGARPGSTAAAVANLGNGQESPAECLVLGVVLAERQGRHRLGELVPEVKRVAVVELRVAFPHLGEQRERVRAPEVHRAVDDVEFAPLC